MSKSKGAEELDKVVVRRWKKKDIPALAACHRKCYPDYPERFLTSERNFEMQFKAFEEGQYLVEVGDTIIGYASSLIVQLDDDIERYRYDEVTGAGTFSTHNPYGDTLYGADIAVLPEYRGKGVSQKLYKRRKALVKRYNLRRMLAFGRIPGFVEHAGKMTAEQYVKRVAEGKVKDPALSAHLRAGYVVKKVLLDYMGDRSSLNHSTLLEWLNPTFNEALRSISATTVRRPGRKVRVCAAQFEMRRIDDWEEFEQTVAFFADAANAYHCHFLVLPEYFTAQLVYTLSEDMSFHSAIRHIAGTVERYKEMLTRFATKYQLYIVGGSTPTERNGLLYNVSYFFTPSGKVFSQDKLHVTPTERMEWDVSPGEGIKIFNTPFCRVAIQICYDVEFPEVTRLLALAGAEVIFVPFSTDEKKGYNRVRYCAQARAVENYVYVVTSGNVGNLPTIENYLINYGQSAVYTPSDFAFPPEAIAGIADPNTETVVIAELDFETLAAQRLSGSVRPFFDRRPDLYSLKEQVSIELVNAY